MTVRVVLVEDHALFRAGSRRARRARRDRGRRRVEIVGEAGSVEEAIAVIRADAIPTSCCSTSTCPAAAGQAVLDGVRDDPIRHASWRCRCRTPPRT